MSNWSLPGLATAYADFLENLKERDVDSVTMFKTGTPSNLPNGAVRLNRTSYRIEEWNGSSWLTPFDTWAISISGNAATATSATVAASCAGNAATASVAGAVPWSGVTGRPTTLGGFGITDGVPSDRSVSAGTGLTGGGALSANRTLSLSNTGVTAGAYGSVAEITNFTVDGQGRLTAASKTALTTAMSSLAAAAGGTANALTVNYTPAITALVDGMLLVVRAATVNTASLVTIAVNGLAAKTIVKAADKPLVNGDIAGASHWLVLVYDSTLGKFVLSNPAISSATGALVSNRIINGCCRVAQRGVSVAAPNPTSTYGGPDRFVAENQAGGQFTQSQASIAPGLEAARPSVRQTVDTAHTAFLGSAYWGGITQHIEGINAGDLVGQQVTLSFIFNASTAGQYSVAVRLLEGVSQSFVTTINVATALNPQRYSITIPALPSAVSGLLGGRITVRIGALNNGTYQTPALGQWNSGHHFSAGNSNAMWSVSMAQFIEASELKLEPGAFSTPFARRLYGHELADCQRYFRVLGHDIAVQGYAPTGGANAFQNIEFPVPMRTTPAISSTFGSGSNSAASGIINASATGAQVYVVSAAGGAFSALYSNTNTFSAEL